MDIFREKFKIYFITDKKEEEGETEVCRGSVNGVAFSIYRVKIYCPNQAFDIISAFEEAEEKKK